MPNGQRRGWRQRQLPRLRRNDAGDGKGTVVLVLAAGRSPATAAQALGLKEATVGFSA